MYFQKTPIYKIPYSKVRNWLKEKPTNITLWKYLCIIYRKLPWSAHIAASMLNQIQSKGKLSDKQKQFIVGLYLNTLYTTDEDIAKVYENLTRLIVLEIFDLEHLIWVLQ